MSEWYQLSADEVLQKLEEGTYDVILLDADRFGVVVADVSDKGMPAALFMTLTRSLLLAEARRERSPRNVLINVHRLLLELGVERDGRFVIEEKLTHKDIAQRVGKALAK